VKFARRTPFAQRVLGAVDLAIDAATLGEYGLEPWPADEPCRERPGRSAGWEALPAARPRGACEYSAPHSRFADSKIPALAASAAAQVCPATPGGRRRLREAA